MKGPRTTTIYINEEDQKMFDVLMKQTGLGKSGLVRHLLHKAHGEGDAAEIREHVASLARLIL